MTNVTRTDEWKVSWKLWKSVATYHSRRFDDLGVAEAFVKEIEEHASTLVGDVGYFDVKMIRIATIVTHSEPHDYGNFLGPEYGPR